VKVRRSTLALLIAAAGAALAVGGGASAASSGAGRIAGIVDVYTNLGYEGAAAAGTGIVLTSDGVVLTNNHVIRGATGIKVTDLDNGRTYHATVLGYTVSGDVAAIKLTNASGLRTAPLGHSSGVAAGQAVTTYGNAGGEGGAPSVASGKIVAVGRSITARDDSGNTETLTDLIETDAALQPGDSGGPMVDSAGKVIGMDTAASSTFTFNGSQSRGFAVPIDRAVSIVSRIGTGHGTSTIHIGRTAFIGLRISVANPIYGYGSSGENGLFVDEVVPGSPAAKAGLGASDVITRFDGKAVTTQTGLTSLLVTKAPGQSVVIRWIDQFNTAHSATLKLASGPPQ